MTTDTASPAAVHTPASSPASAPRSGLSHAAKTAILGLMMITATTAASWFIIQESASTHKAALQQQTRLGLESRIAGRAVQLEIALDRLTGQTGLIVEDLYLRSLLAEAVSEITLVEVLSVEMQTRLRELTNNRDIDHIALFRPDRSLLVSTGPVSTAMATGNATTELLVADDMVQLVTRSVITLGDGTSLMAAGYIDLGKQWRDANGLVQEANSDIRLVGLFTGADPWIVLDPVNKEGAASGMAGTLSPAITGLQLTRDIQADDQDAWTLVRETGIPDFYLVAQRPAAAIQAQIRAFYQTRLYLVGGLNVLAIVMIVLFWHWSRQQGNTRQPDMDLARYAFLDERIQALEVLQQVSPNIIYIKDRQNHILLPNLAFARLLGKSIDDITGSQEQDQFDGELLSLISELDFQVTRTGNRANGICDDADDEAWEVSVIPLDNEDMAEEFHRAVIVRDISHRRRMEKSRDALQHKTMMALVGGIERRDPHLSGHSRSVALLACGIASQLNQPPATIKSIEQAAMLSQLGKAFVPSALLAKSGKLSPAELAEIQKHITYTVDTVTPIGLPSVVVKGLGQMCERLDGSGYPKQLQGDHIGLEGRILGLADTVVAMTSPRAFRNARTVQETLRFVRQHGNLFDTALMAPLESWFRTPQGKAFDAEISARQESARQQDSSQQASKPVKRIIQASNTGRVSGKVTPVPKGIVGKQQD